MRCIRHRQANRSRRLTASFLCPMSVPSETADPAPISQDVGMGRVLQRVRQPGEEERPHVVEFRHVTKTYNAGLSNEFTAIRDVSFVVADLPNKGEFVCILGPSG